MRVAGRSPAAEAHFVRLHGLGAEYMHHHLCALVLASAATFVGCENQPALAPPEAGGLRLDVATSRTMLGAGDTAIIRVYWRNVSTQARPVAFDCGPQLFVAGTDGTPMYFPWASDSSCPGLQVWRDTFSAGFTDSSQFIVAVRGATPHPLQDHNAVCLPGYECTALVILPPGRYYTFARLRAIESTPSLRSANVFIEVP